MPTSNKGHLRSRVVFLIVAMLGLYPTLGCQRLTTATPTLTPATTTTPIPGASPTLNPETMEVKVYFPRSVENDIVFVEVTRIIPKTLGTGRAALEELLKGPTEGEKARGLFTPIPEGTRLLSADIKDSTFFANFDARMLEVRGGSTRIMEVIRTIELTLKQFPTIRDVRILVEGQEGVLQP